MDLIAEKKIIFDYSEQKNQEIYPKAIFLDRDGVVNEDCHYIKDPLKVKLCKGAKSLIRKIFSKGIPIVVITNQSGISRKILTWEDYYLVNEKIIEQLGIPNPISAIYANSHTTTNQGNNWRKPNPHMIIQASLDLKINLQNSILIGDRLTDLQAGYRAGIKKLIHVMTGHGFKERDKVISNFKNGISNDVEIILINNLLEFPFKLLN